MTNLAIKTIALAESGKNSFEILFRQGLQFNDVDSLESKIKFLSEVLRNISERESNAENAKAVTSWVSIVSAIGATATVMSMPFLTPLLGFFTLATIGGSVFKTQQETPVIETLKKYEIALARTPLDNWAGLWQCTNTDVFLESLYEASTGQIYENKLIGRKVDSWDAAVEYSASILRIKPLQLVELIHTVQSGKNLSQVNIPKEKILATASPTITSDSFAVSNSEMFNNAIAIRDSLVNRASESVLGGCVILAAPGAGKTTFLGTAWGKLKAQYGDKFKSLAIVVKKSDVDAFRGVSDKCLCVKAGAVTAAVEIIKFIDGSTSHTGNVSRLFIDDFLTAQKYFETSLKGKFIDPYSYAVFDNKKDASEFSFDCLPLYDHLMTLLNEYWLVGREFNSALYVSSHSSNVQDLPFMGSASARSVGDLIFLAKNGKREFIELALGNNFLISDNNKRASLKSQLDSIDVTSDEPIVLANYNNWSLGVVPSSVYEEYQGYRKLWQSNALTMQPTQDNFSAETKEEFIEEVLQKPSEANQSDSRENDFDFILEMANVAKNHILQNEWSEFTTEKLRKVHRFKEVSERGNYLKTSEMRAVIRFLVHSGFLIENSPENFRVTALS